MHRLMELKGAKSVGRELLRSPTQAASSLTVQLYPALVQTVQLFSNRVHSLRPAKRQAFAPEDAVTCPLPPTLFQAKLQTLFFSFYSYIICFSLRCLRRL